MAYENGKKKIIRLGVDIPMLDYFVSQGINDKDGTHIASTTQLMEIVEETYPEPKEKDKRRPAVNVVSAVIKYVKRYFLYKDNPDRYPQVWSIFIYLL